MSLSVFTNAANYPSTFPKLKTEIKVEAQTFSFGGYDYVFAGSTGNGYYQLLVSEFPFCKLGVMRATNIDSIFSIDGCSC